MNASIRPSGGAVTQFPMMPEKITLGADAKFMTCLLYTSPYRFVSRSGQRLEENSPYENQI